MSNTYEPPSDLDPPVLPDPEQYKIHADACCRGRIGVLLPVNSMNGHYIHTVAHRTALLGIVQQ